MHWTARAGGALGEVVDGADRDQPAGGLVDGDLEVHGVGAEHRLGLRPLPLRQQVHERLVGVGLLRRPRGRSSAVDAGRGGAEQVARMPRGIGTSSGVKRHPHVGRRSSSRRGSGRSRGCAGGRRRRRTRWREPITSQPSRCGLAALPAPEVPEAATTTTSAASTRPAATAGRQGQRGDGRVAAGYGDPAWRRASCARWPGSSGRP